MKNLEKLTNIIESILFVSGTQVALSDITDKLEVSEKEINEVVKILKKDPNKSIGIITFYRKQVDVINEYKINLTDEQKTRVEIGTVDAFQGKEFDVVFLSCVRANNYSEDDLHKKIGHSSDKNRLCVSYTRARQLLVTVGDKETMSFIPEMKELIEICEKGDVGHYELIKE